MLNDNAPASWRYRTFPAGLDAGAFGPFAGFVTIWRKKFEQHTRFPDWRQFRFEDFSDWYGRMSLAEVHRNPLDLRFALWGGKLVEWWQLELTGKFISEDPRHVDIWQQVEMPYFTRLIEHGEIGYPCGPLDDVRRATVYVQAIDLPLERDGKISHFLSAYQRVVPARAFVPAVSPAAEF